MRDDLEVDLLPEFFATIKTNYGGDIDRFVDEIYERSMFASQDRLLAALEKPDWKVEDDMAYGVSKQIEKKWKELFALTSSRIGAARKAIFEYNKGVLNLHQQDYYPDADKTIRLSYGTVRDITKNLTSTVPHLKCLVWTWMVAIHRI